MEQLDTASASDRHNLVCYLGSMIITFFCFYGFNYLVTWLTIQKTGNPQTLGHVMALMMLPAIGLNLVAGQVLSHYSAKTIMFVTDILTALLFIGAYGWFEIRNWTITGLVVVAILNKSIGVFYKLGNKTVLPELFASTRLKTINGYQTQIRQLAIVSATTIITGALLWLDPATLILIMGGAFGFSTWLDWQFQVSPSAPSPQAAEHSSYRSVALPKWALSYAVIGYLIDAVVAVCIPWIAVTYLQGHWQLSWLLTANALGILLGPIVFRRSKPYTLLTLTLSAGICLLFMRASLYQLLPMMLVLGVLRSQTNIQFFTHIQQMPTSNRHALMMWVLTIIDTSTVIGSLLAPRLILHLGSWALPVLGAVIVGFCLIKQAIDYRHR